MTVDLLLGLQWGDEGKIVDVLTSKYDIIAFSRWTKCRTHIEFDGKTCS
jgi:adenylosuccinate synthase